MHLVLTPSWYPDRRHPNNGSFFRDQAGMLRRAGMRVGVIALTPTSAWRARRGLSVDVEDGVVVVRGDVPLVPKGIAPGDRASARAAAGRAADLYDRTVRELGGTDPVPDVVHAHSVFTGIHVGLRAAERWDAGLAITEHRPSSTDRSRLGWRYRALRRRSRRRLDALRPGAGGLLGGRVLGGHRPARERRRLRRAPPRGPTARGRRGGLRPAHGQPRLPPGPQ